MTVMKRKMGKGRRNPTFGGRREGEENSSDIGKKSKLSTRQRCDSRVKKNSGSQPL